MIPPRNPDNENERLAAVHATELLDTPLEERFDRITRIAQRLFNVPICLISMVDANRQWFKSCIGLPISETSRESSFCGHAILTDDVFVIEDAHKDERFSDNPLVVGEPYIRFYAGYPIRIGRSLKMGTLCIIDRIPRDFHDEDRASLIDLGNIVESELSNLDLAVRDELTNLLNRRGFRLLVKNNISLSLRGKFNSTLVVFDLDNFKGINDQYGHNVGDQVLSNFASLLSGCIRASDLVARLGGDEFAIMFNNSNEEQSQIALSNLKELVDEYNSAIEGNLRIGYSYGLQTIDSNSDIGLDGLLEKADLNMYQHKKSKKARA